MAVETTTALLIVPSLVMGVIYGVLNLIMMVKDETGSANSVVGHGASAFIAMIVLTFFSMNLNLFPQLLPSIQGTFLANEIVMRIAIALITTIYVHVHSGLFKGARGAGMHETWAHSLIAGVAIGAAPYVWLLLSPILPSYLGGGQ